MISNSGFSVTKISPSKHHAEPLYDGKSWILSSQMIMSNNRDGLSLLTHTFGIIWHSGVRHQVAATALNVNRGIRLVFVDEDEIRSEM